MTIEWDNQPRKRRCRIAHGTSLIEVIAATVILGTAVTVLLSMQAASLERMHSIDNELLAAEMAHEIFADWRLQRAEYHDATEGIVENYDGWSWRSRSARVVVAPDIEADLITLTIRRSGRLTQGSAFEREFLWLDHKLGND